MNDNHEGKLFASIVFLADSLVSDFDLVDLCTRLVDTCQDLLPISSAGIVLSDQTQHLRVLASSNEDGRTLELMEVQNNEGPCLDAFRTGMIVSAPRLRGSELWPRFAAQAFDHGVLAAYAVPLRLRARTIGALNMFSRSPGALTRRDLDVAKLLADVATISILSHRNIRDQEILAEQLQTALNSRVAIEQAKGILAERLGCSTGEAFQRLRAYARRQRRPLIEVANGVVRGEIRLVDEPQSAEQDLP